MEISGDEINGFMEDLGKILRPKDATGEIQPLGTVEIKLSKETKIFLGLLLLGGIVVSVGVSQAAQNMNK